MYRGYGCGAVTRLEIESIRNGREIPRPVSRASCYLSRALLLVSARGQCVTGYQKVRHRPLKGREPLTGHQISPCLPNLSPPTGVRHAAPLQQEQRWPRRSGCCSSPPRRDGQVHRVFLPRDRLKAFENPVYSLVYSPSLSLFEPWFALIASRNRAQFDRNSGS